MRRFRPVILSVSGLLALVSTGARSPAPQLSPREAPPRVTAGFGKLPLVFEPNRGQSDSQALFVARGRGYGLFLTATESVLVLRSPAESAAPAAVRMRLVGANPRPAVNGKEQLPGHSNYFIGNDPKMWRTGVPHYARVEYEEVYPGVDLAYYGKEGQLEYDFVVAPGADPRQIRFAIEGAEALRIDDAGNLVLGTPGGEVVQRAPLIYQDVGGTRRPIAGRFALRAPREVGFEVDRYDAGYLLVLDPVLSYSTYIGGSGDDRAWAIAVDTSGNSYIAGSTDSIDFPAGDQIQPTKAALIDGFVLKLNASGNVVYSTYLGGSGNDTAFGIAVDTSGHAYVAGFTNSRDFPTVSPLQPANGGGDLDAFVAKLDEAGSALVYSTYLGGSDYDDERRLAVDASGNAYVTGMTRSNNFPTAAALQPAYAGGYDAYVAKLNPAGSAFVYSTYLGGLDMEIPFGIASDTSGNAFVTGSTASMNFPTANAFQTVMAGFSDAFVAKLSATGSVLAYSTYLGGTGNDVGDAITVDASGNAYIAGSTESTDFPTVSAFQAANAGGFDVFVTKLDATGTSLGYSTYLGGSISDYPTAVAVDTVGSAHITGFTLSDDFPLVRSFQPFDGRGGFNAYAAKLSVSGSSLRYSTCLRGSGSADYGQGIAVDSSGTAHVVGMTTARDFPMRHPAQGAYAGGTFDVFAARIADRSPPPGDYDFDGQPDILWRDQGSTGHIGAWFMNGTKMTSAALTNPSPFSILSWEIVGTADFNGDDKQDILWRDQGNTGHIAVWFMDGMTMTSAALTDPSPFPLLNWRIVGTGDFNGDGKPDILWRNQTGAGEIAVWFMDGTTRIGATLTDPPSFPLQSWKIVGTSDFNGDGQPDLLWRNQAGNGEIAVWFMDGTTRIGATLTDPPSFPILNWEIVGVGDFNGDGKPDLLWRNQAGSGDIAVWFMDGTTRIRATLTDPPSFSLLNWKIVGPR